MVASYDMASLTHLLCGEENIQTVENGGVRAQGQDRLPCCVDNYVPCWRPPPNATIYKYKTKLPAGLSLAIRLLLHVRR